MNTNRASAPMTQARNGRRDRLAAALLAASVLAALALHADVRAAQPEDVLLDRGIAAYGAGRCTEAVMYLYAYEERDPRLFQEEPSFRQRVGEAIEYCKQRLDGERRELENLRARVADMERRAGVGASVAGLTRAPPPLARPLAAPEPLAPAAGVVFSHFPRVTVVSWRAVPGAATYTVEVDCLHCCQSDRWCTDVGRSYIVATGVRGTSYEFSFAGAQPGRWRVSAADAAGHKGRPSPWREFSYSK